MTKAEIQQLVVQKAQDYGLDPRIGLAQIRQESGFNPRAVGPPTRFGTAKGLAQFIDDTASRYGIINPFDPEQALDGWARYMRDLLGQFNQRYDLALAAYNWGPNHSTLTTTANSGGSFPAGKVPAETRKYVQTILRNASSSSQPRAVIASAPAPAANREAATAAPEATDAATPEAAPPSANDATPEAAPQGRVTAQFGGMGALLLLGLLAFALRR